MCDRRRSRGFHTTSTEVPRVALAFIVSAAIQVFNFDVLALADVCVAYHVAAMEEHCSFAPLGALGETNATPHLRVIQESNYALARKNFLVLFLYVLLRRGLRKGGFKFSFRDRNCFDGKGFGRRGHENILGQRCRHNLRISNGNNGSDSS